MGMDRCLTCGSDDLMHFGDGSLCQRCRSFRDNDGWTEYNPEEVQDNIDRYDEQFDN